MEEGAMCSCHIYISKLADLHGERESSLKGHESRLDVLLLFPF